MALTAAQQKVARLIYQSGIRAGLTPARARELVAASYAESGLNPGARNKSSGAAGLFQLLSSGYVQRANKMGGVYNPQANINAILPNYVGYWKSHPNAAPGAAGRDVELSGEGAGFYSSPLSLLGNLGGGGVATGAVPAAGTPGPRPGSAPDTLNNPMLNALVAGKPINFLDMPTPAPQSQLAAAATGPTTRRAATQGPVGGTHAGGLAEAFYDPLGSYDNGHFGGAIGGHSDHVHLSITNPQTMLTAISYATAHGLRVGENPYVGKVYPVHVKGSFHYRDFPGRYRGKQLGEAIDVTGNPAAMAAFYKWATRSLR